MHAHYSYVAKLKVGCWALLGSIQAARSRTGCAVPQSDEARFLGEPVSKRFGRKRHSGHVVGVDECDQTGWPMWRVRYADGDEEDCYADELAAILV